MFMMSAILLQKYLAPGNPPDPGAEVEQGPAAVVAQAEPANGLLDQPEKPDPEKIQVDQELETADEPKRSAEDEFVTFGSLAPDGSDRYLVTANKRGATIARIELNFRDSKGRYKYRDLVWEGGYLGCLDVVNTEDGIKIRSVGKGTPAEMAGVQVGDVIKSINGEPITSAIDFETYLEKKTKPNTDVELVVVRNGQPETFSIGLTQKPIQVIRPEPGIVDPDFDFPESFVFSLVKPLEELDKAWPDLDSEMRDCDWEVSQATAEEIEFKFELSPVHLKKLDVPGPLTVFKRFKLPEVPADATDDLNSRSFHLVFEVEIKNGSDHAQRLAYEIDGPTGLTAETWWYANKIHGRQTAIGYIAGARDIVGSTGDNSYVFFGCPEIVKAAQKTVPTYSYICSPYEEDERNRQLNFVGVDSHYFNVSMIPRVLPGELYETNSVLAYLNNRQGRIPAIPKNVRLQKLVDCTFQLVAPAAIEAGGSFKKSFDVFVGPKDPDVLRQYGLSDVRTFGWFAWCSVVLLWILHFFYLLTFKTSYGLAIIMLTVMVRCLMIPMSRKAALNAQMMQHLQPQMKEIADKYKDDMEKRAAAQRELYKTHKFNPFGGCFMMFFQLPIFYGLYKALNVDIALRGQPLVPGMQWCSNLAAPDQLYYWADWMPSALASETGWLGPYFNLLPILTMVLFIVQQKLFTPPPTDDQQKMMHKMMTFMMVFMGVMFFKVPAGLCIYFITSSLWGIIERKMLPKPVLNTDNLALEGVSPRTSRKLQKAELLDNKKREAEAESRRIRNAERKKRLKQRGT